MNKQYCPECITELKRQSKKLGQFSVWLVCPICGYRERPKNHLTEEAGAFIDRIRENNKNINQFNIDAE